MSVITPDLVVGVPGDPSHAMYFRRGIGRITEPVTTQGVPVNARRVRLVDQRSGQLVAEGLSDPAAGGNVTFAGLALDRLYLLYAIDDTQTYQAVAITHRYATVSGARPVA